MTTVAYDHQIFSSQRFGGISRYFCEIATRVSRKSGWRSRVIAPLHCNEHLAGSSAPRLGVHLAPRFRGTGLLCRTGNAVLGPPLLAAVGADVVHRTYYCTRPKLASARLVVTVHDMIHELFPESFPADDPTRKLKRRCVEAADRVICVSHSTADDLMRLLGVPEQKISIIHHGFSASFAELPVVKERMTPTDLRPYLLYVGHRSGYKNFGLLLRAYAASPRLRRDFDLVAFGGPSFGAEELSLIKSLRLQTGSVRRESGGDVALARAYAGAYAFVYPSAYEGFGIPPLEAMSCGCPVVCSNTSSIPEVVGDAGEYFEPGSVESMRAAIERLTDDDALRRTLIATGREQCRRFSWDQCADETLDAYRAALAA